MKLRPASSGRSEVARVYMYGVVYTRRTGCSPEYTVTKYLAVTTCTVTTPSRSRPGSSIHASPSTRNHEDKKIVTKCVAHPLVPLQVGLVCSLPPRLWVYLFLFVPQECRIRGSARPRRRASILFAVWRQARWKALAAGHQHSWQRGRGQRLRLGMAACYVYVKRESKRSMPERDCECLLMALVCFSS